MFSFTFFLCFPFNSPLYFREVISDENLVYFKTVFKREKMAQMDSGISESLTFFKINSLWFRWGKWRRRKKSKRDRIHLEFFSAKDAFSKFLEFLNIQPLKGSIWEILIPQPSCFTCL